MRGVKETDNIIDKIAEKGFTLTFDNEGLPMLMKPTKPSNLDTKTDFEVGKDVLVQK